MGATDTESLPDGIPIARSSGIGALRRIDRALREAHLLDQALSRALEETLDVFDCDRAWLLYLDDRGGADGPRQGAHWEIPIERTRPEFPGALARRQVHVAGATSLALFAEVLENERPVVFDPRTARELPESAKRYGVSSQMMVRLRPRVGPPWIFGLHHCRGPRIWSEEDRELSLSVRDRLGEVLSNLLLSEKLRRSEDRWRTLFGALPDPVCLQDGRGRWLLANEATLAIFGLEGVEYRGRTDAELVRECTRNPEALLAHHRAEERAYREGAGVQESETLCTPTGSLRMFDVLRLPLFHTTGERKGLITLARDTTLKHEADAELQRLEASMQNAQKLESLGVLAGGLAHDFNNILMGVMGYAGLALAVTPEDAPSHGYLQEIEAAAERAAELAGQMLAYSGRGRFIVSAFDIGQLVEGMLQLLRASISKKTVLRISCGQDLPPVQGDLTQIRQVIMNLVTNASDATDDQGGVIDIVLGTRQADRKYLDDTYLDDELPEGLYVAVEVSDSGCGMDEATISRIFDPFFTTKASGRGLGMAAVLGIVRGHRGTIKIRSEPDLGTRFEVLLPIATEVDEPATSELSQPSIDPLRNPSPEEPPPPTPASRPSR